MDAIEVKRLYQEFVSTVCSEERERTAWLEHQRTFREFWQNKILPKTDSRDLSEADYDSIIKIIDVKARGHQKDDVAVAHVGLYQGTWYRIFNDLVQKENLKRTMDKIFKARDDETLKHLIDRLYRENESNKNGLTGKNANALNALLFLNYPDNFISSVSLRHRLQIVDTFGFGDSSSYKTYGEKVVGTNRTIINGFREKYVIDAAPRTISQFLYLSGPVRSFWMPEEEPEQPSEHEPHISEGKSEFLLEKHLENYLVENWETTDLGRKYDLIWEEGELKSQQYPTDIGPIDLLVREKKNGVYVVIELKKGQTSDDTAGQLLRYMGWVKQHLASGEKVKGIVIAHADDKRLVYALSMIPSSEFLVYEIKFSLRKP